VTQKAYGLPPFSLDYVYVETAPVYPYQIRRIEELTKLGNGQIEAKVQCFYRRRDLSNPLIAQADRHAGELGTF
jgi:metastasis-associated protein MTA